MTTAVVKGGFWEQYGATYTQLWGYAPLRRFVQQRLGRKQLMAYRALAVALDGVAAGATATKALSRIANSTELGGQRAIESESLVNRATVAGDVTTLNNKFFAFSSKTYNNSPVANLDGNPLGTR